jgi:hypothetical protein
MKPVDLTTGLQCGQEPITGDKEIIKGYLVTLPDGHECRLGPDLTRAQNYAAQNHSALIEPMYVRR